MNFHFWGYEQKPFPKQIGTLASENGPAGSIPRWRLGHSVSLAQEGTSSRASRRHHSQVPRDRISPDKLQQELWHGGINPIQPKSEKQAEIRVSINAHHTSSLIQARLCLSFTHPTNTYCRCLCSALGQGLGREGWTRKPRSRVHEARILGGVRRQRNNKELTKIKLSL